MFARIRWIRMLLLAMLVVSAPAASALATPPSDAVTLLLPYNSVTGKISTSHPIDYYKFFGQAGLETTIWLQAQSIGSGLVGIVALYDSTGKLLVYNDGELNLISGRLGDPILYVKLPSTDTYYISVNPAENFRKGPAAGPVAGGGDYGLILSIGFDNARIADPYEPNDTLQTATPISAPFQSYGANLLFFGDFDWYRFNAKKGQKFSIDVDALEMKSKPGWDLIVRTRVGLFDEAGHLLSAADRGGDPDSGYGDDPGLVFTAPRDGKYYIAVTVLPDTQFQTPFKDSGFLSDPYVSSASYRIGYYQLEVRELNELFFPQVANGSFGEFYFTTSIILLNHSPRTASGNVSFYKSDGSPMLVTTQSGEPGNTYWFNLPSKGSLVLKTEGSGSGASGYAVITSTAPIGGSAVFSQYENSGLLVTEAGVSSSAPMEFFAVPVDTTGQFNTGLAIVNSGNSAPVSLTFKLLDISGQAVASRSLSLEPWRQMALFVAGADQLFPNARSLRGSLQVFADSPVTAVALRSSSRTLTTLNPAALNQTFDPVSLVFPQIVTGSAGNYYRSSIILMNTGYFKVSGTIRFTRSDGKPMVVSIGSAQSSIHSLSIPPLSTVFLEASAAGGLESGYATLSADHGLGGIALISQFDVSTGMLQSEVGVAPARNYSHFYVFAQNDGAYNTGLAIANPDSNSATIDYDLRPASDLSQVFHKGPVVLGSGAHIAEFVSGSDQLFPNFTGLGTLEVTSAIPIPALTLRLSARTMTALPVIPAP